MHTHIRHIAATLSLTLFLILIMAEQGRGNSLFIHDGKLYLSQQDNALVILDIHDGTVLRRFQLRDTVVGMRFVIIGDMLGLRLGQGMALLDAKSGELREVIDGTLFKHYENSLFSLKYGTDNSFVIAARDTSQGKRLWEYSGKGRITEMLVARDRVFLFRFSALTNSMLLCLDAASGSVLWSAFPDEQSAWLRAVCSEDRIYVIAGQGDGETPTAATILSWDHDGAAQPPLSPGPEAAGQDIHSLHRVEVVIEGQVFPSEVWTREEMPASLLHVDDEQLLSQNPSHSIETFQVAGGGWLVEMNRDENAADRMESRLNRALVFYSPERKWSGKPGYLHLNILNDVDDAVADDRVVIISTWHGQVECLDRETGESRWIYIYPTWRGQLAIPMACTVSWRNTLYYTEKLKRYREETAGHGVSGTVIDGETRTMPWRIVLDPRPTTYHEDYPIIEKLLIAIHILCMLAMIIDMCAYYQYRGGAQPGRLLSLFCTRRKSNYSEAVLYSATILVFTLAYVYFGRYSPALAAAQLGSLGFSFICFLFFLIMALKKEGLHWKLTPSLLFPGIAAWMIYLSHTVHTLP